MTELSDIQTVRKWVNFCKRKEMFNHICSFICRDHFVDDDFIRLMQFAKPSMRKNDLNKGNKRKRKFNKIITYFHRFNYYNFT